MVKQHAQSDFIATVGSDCAWTNATASAEVVWRPLDTSESLFADFNAAGAFLTAQALDVHGPISESLLVQALAHVEKRHPLLRARIVRRGNSLYWAERAAEAPRIVRVDRVPPGGLEALTEVELHRPYDGSDERLWRCTWLPLGNARHWIVLALHHAVADGISSMVVVRDLVATLSALSGVGEMPRELPLGKTLDEALPPVSPMVLLRHKARRLRSRLLGSPPTLPLESTAPPENRRTGVIFGSIRGDLRAGAHSHGTTINGVLAAALLDSVRQTLGPLPLVPVTHPVSLRGTAIPPDQVGCFATNVVTLHPIPTRWSFWHEARSTTDQLHRALERGDAAAALLASRGKVAFSSAAMSTAIHDRRTAGRIGAICISNRGWMTDFSTGPFRVAAWYPATSNHPFGNDLQLNCATVGDTFFFALMHVVPLMSVASARRIADRFAQRLMGVARGAV